MFAALIPKPTPWYQSISINWFDFVLLGILAFGYWRGSKRGMTKEILPTIEWLTILLVAGLCHTFLADLLEHLGLIRQVFGKHFNERTAALVTAYVIIMVVFFCIFSAIKRKYNPKLEGSSLFGSNEYYWGIVAGLVRYACLVLIGLSLLNAPLYTADEIARQKAYNNRWYGGGMKDYKGDFIPAMYDVQDSVFKKSLTGPLIKQNLSMLLINSPAPVTNKKSAHS